MTLAGIETHRTKLRFPRRSTKEKPAITAGWKDHVLT
jgi:hypothetical protein